MKNLRLKTNFIRLGFVLGAALVFAVSSQAYIADLSDSEALPVTQNVYHYIASRSASTTNKMIEGQHLGGVNEILYPNIYGPFDINSHAISGKLPGMVGTRYDATDKQKNKYILDPDVCTALNNQLISIWNSSQPIIHITAIPPNPWHPQSGRDPYLPSNNIGELLLEAPSSPAKTAFWASIDIIAKALKQLQDAGIPVVFRPFAEFNQSNKYYYANQTPAHFTQLWKDVYDYYVGVKNLHNLIFCWEVWALNRSGSETNIDPWYPGDGFVDVVAGAYYFQSDLNYVNAAGVFSFPKANDQTIYNYLISRNRPFGAAQWGLNQGGGGPGDHNFTLSFMNYSPQLAFAYYWTNDQAVEVQAHGPQFVVEPRVATADDLPGFSVRAFTSISSEDGWVREYPEGSGKGGMFNSSDASGLALRTGDMGSAKMDGQYKTIVSFDTSTLPAHSVITGATLRLKRGGLSGQNPFLTHGSCLVDIAGGVGFGGGAALANRDFEDNSGAVIGVATMSDPGADGNWSTGVLNASGAGAVNKAGRTQLRVYFTLGDDDNGHDNFVGWFSGEAAPESQPELMVNYKYQ